MTSAQINQAKYGMMDEDLPQGLNIGDKAPDIELSDQYGDTFLLIEALKKGPVVITFYRGNWCPHCSRYLAALSDSINFIIAAGAQFVAISPESSENVKKTAEGLSKHIKILNDKDGRVMKLYDVDFEVTKSYQSKIEAGLQRSIKNSNEQEVAILPVPATYIIAKEGNIIFRHFDENYRNRASINSILAALK